MTSRPFLVSHALDHVWCAPPQDLQRLIIPTRYSPSYGAINSVKIFGFSTQVPVVAGIKFFHVYHIGQLPDVLLTLQGVNVHWKNAQDLANANGNVIDVFLSSGVKVPLAHCWFKRMFDGNILLSVEIHKDFNFGTKTIIDGETNISQQVPRKLSNDTLYFRTYNSSTSHQTAWRDAAAQLIPVKYYSKKINAGGDFTSFMASANGFEASFGGQGVARYYADGFLITKPTGYSPTLYAGKTLSFYYDEMVIKTFSIPLLSCPSFTSTKDYQTQKLLVLSDKTYGGIDYFDDIDFYLTVGTGTAKKGIFLAKVTETAIRMVTHNAYSLNANLVQKMLNDHPEFANRAAVTLTAYVRVGGMKQGLVHQRSRIEDLYKLTYEQIKQAMTGINSTMPEWRAPALEASAYSTLMGAKWNEVDINLVNQAYGYYAASTVAFNPVQVPDDNTIQFNPGYCFPMPNPAIPNTGVFRYDDDRKLIGQDNFTLGNGDATGTLTHAASYVETFNLPIDDTNDGTLHDQDVISADLVRFGFRAYVCAIVGGIPNEHWEDVTGSPFYTYYPDGFGGDTTPQIKWNYGLLSGANLFPSVRIAKSVLFYDQPVQVVDYPGFILFNVVSTVAWNSLMQSRPQTIPFDTLEIFMDGLTLIEDIDYYVRWPTVCIVKKPTTDIEDTLIQVRAFGYAKSLPLSHRKPREVGFVRGGILSVNGIYDPRNDRNIRTIVAGVPKLRSEVNFDEQNTGALVTDGVPYSIDDYRFNTEAFLPGSTNIAIDDAQALDKRVSDYVTVRLPQYNPPYAFLEAGKWKVVSPLISAILHAFVNSAFLAAGELDQAYDNVQVDAWIANLKYLIPFEPSSNNVDLRFVDVRPHQYDTPMTVDINHFLFLEYVNRLYLQGSVDITAHVTIGV